ncbi:hypothetical protein ACP2W0_11605 [Pseudobacillus badius]|uniref:hypothetical protein n=1 Tax=Bacillus badius TaxID=1455 RepID=UPI0005974EF0|nr:hypothetical protein [Bacillus badius]KZR57273.1 hypothetical protein A3781_03655 [Bacillus badius]UAT31711.1 hypothetical protein K7T73_05655 [Bacillus badius]GLY10600.1 hypothetical protein Bbad01_18160 [Bacillus badius]
MKWLAIILTMFFFAGCSPNIPEPETMSPSASMSEAEAQTLGESWTVKHLLRGKNVFVELVVPGVSFSKDRGNSQAKGQVAVFVNGKHYQTYHTAAFIIKGLDAGRHQIDIKLTDESSRPLGYEKSFTVSIP